MWWSDPTLLIKIIIDIFIWEFVFFHMNNKLIRIDKKVNVYHEMQFKSVWIKAYVKCINVA